MPTFSSGVGYRSLEEEHCLDEIIKQLADQPIDLDEYLALDNGNEVHVSILSALY